MLAAIGQGFHGELLAHQSRMSLRVEPLLSILRAPLGNDFVSERNRQQFTILPGYLHDGRSARFTVRFQDFSDSAVVIPHLAVRRRERLMASSRSACSAGRIGTRASGRGAMLRSHAGQ